MNVSTYEITENDEFAKSEDGHVVMEWADDRVYLTLSGPYAVAPELLKSCQELLSELEAEYEADPEREDLTMWKRIITAAHEVIAKAEGSE